MDEGIIKLYQIVKTILISGTNEKSYDYTNKQKRSHETKSEKTKRTNYSISNSEHKIILMNEMKTFCQYFFFRRIGWWFDGVEDAK